MKLREKSVEGVEETLCGGFYQNLLSAWPRKGQATRLCRRGLLTDPPSPSSYRLTFTEAGTLLSGADKPTESHWACASQSWKEKVIPGSEQGSALILLSPPVNSLSRARHALAVRLQHTGICPQ